MTAPVQVNPSGTAIHTPPPSAGGPGGPSSAQFAAWRSQLIQAVVQAVVSVLTGFVLPGDALAQLSSWVNLALPAQIFAPVQSVIDTIFNSFDSGISGNTSGNSLEDAFKALLGILNVAGQAQSQNIIQDTRINLLLLGASPTGTSVEENYDGAAGASLSSTDWNLTHTPTTGGGGPLLAGDGTLYWQKDGSGAVSGYRMRYKSKTLDTDTHLVQLVLMSDIPFTSLTLPYVSIFDRMNTAETDYIEYRIEQAQVSIYIWVAGTPTLLGSAVSHTTPKAGTWTVKSGTDTPTTGPREFVLLQNGAEKIRRADTGATSGMDASHRQVGCYMLCGNQFDPFFGISQAPGPNFGSFAAVDRLAST